jgi:glutathione S-transferase
VANTLFVIPGSHPCVAVQTALELKGVRYRRIDLIPVLHRLVARIAYGRRTVPGMWLGGRRIAGSGAIMRRLDELAPEPRMYPLDPERSVAVARAEAWGDEVLQPVLRRLVWAAVARAPETMESFAAEAKLGLPTWITRPCQPLVARLACWANHVSDPVTRDDLHALPGHLDRIDAWIADGTLGGPSPNAADLQIGASLQLLASIGDLAPLLQSRPAQRLTAAIIARPGGTPAGLLPTEWLAA